MTGDARGIYKVAEPPEYYGDPKRKRLVREVKRFALEADADLVEALLKNVEAFKELMELRETLREK